MVSVEKNTKNNVVIRLNMIEKDEVGFRYLVIKDRIDLDIKSLLEIISEKDKIEKEQRIIKLVIGNKQVNNLLVCNLMNVNFNFYKVIGKSINVIRRN